MSEFEIPEDDFRDDELSGSNRSGDDMTGDDLSDDDFVIDGELQEIEKQLMSDADHMHSLYPSMNSRRLEELVSKCVIEAQECLAEKSDDTSGQKQAVGAEQVRSKVKTGSRVGKWIQFSSAVSLCVAFASIVFVWNLPTSDEPNQTAESSSTDSDWVETRPVSLEEMPREILNASQPELEAIYDMMPTENVSVEF